MAVDVIPGLCEVIRDGTFPDSDETLRANLPSDRLLDLLNEISALRNDLSDEIQNISHDDSHVVDDWITEAKKVQQGLVQCKNEVKQIVKEHQRVEALRASAHEAGNKVLLLQREVDFTYALETELQSIASAAQTLDKIESGIANHDYVTAVQNLRSTDQLIPDVYGSQTRSLLAQIREQQKSKTSQRLSRVIEGRVIVQKHEEHLTLQILSNGRDGQTDRSADDLVATMSLSSILDLVETLGDLDGVATYVLGKLESEVLPLFTKKSQLKPVKAFSEGDSLTIEVARRRSSAFDMLDVTSSTIKFLHSCVPEKLQHKVLSQFLPRMLAMLIDEWLDPAIPSSVADLTNLVPLQHKVSHLDSILSDLSWPGSGELTRWQEQIGQSWIAKRRTESLDAVRQAFNVHPVTTKQVQRVEKQPVNVQPATTEVQGNNAEWGVGWEDERSQEAKRLPADSSTDDDDGDAWGFDADDEEQRKDVQKSDRDSSQPEDDGTEAWGWDDEGSTGDHGSPKVSTRAAGPAPPKVEPLPSQKTQEIILTEMYSISDIPDRLIQIVTKDLEDAATVQKSPAYFQSDLPVSGLLSLPTLVFAMFRATAQTYYGASPSLSNMNLFNDCEYISQKLREDASLIAHLEADYAVMSKFARSAYSREMEVQRTILSDLLDGAQAFVSCTKFPYSQECENAVLSTVDRLRVIQKDWQPILSPSHLQQALGALLSMVIGKMIKDIEDLDDISEPESQRLHMFCEQVSAVQDVFSAKPPGMPEQLGTAEEVQVTSVAVYVHNWLRFQYLMQILESSLVDIKYLWTDAGLSLEFSQEEVVDLIKALFAESTHRRSAISAIRG